MLLLTRSHAVAKISPRLDQGVECPASGDDDDDFGDDFGDDCGDDDGGDGGGDDDDVGDGGGDDDDGGGGDDNVPSQHRCDFG